MRPFDCDSGIQGQRQWTKMRRQQRGMGKKEDVERRQCNNQIKAAAMEVGDSGHWFLTAAIDNGV